MEILSYRDALHRSMLEILRENPHAFLLGQGVNDPTRIFGTTKGIQEEFGPNRIYDTSVSEEGMTGVAIGAALNGMFPIMTHIRVDFILLAMNQIINLAAKYKYMYDGSFEVPMLIRAVVGRSWGQGPQHSQSLQSLFAHIPGLTVIMPSNANSVYNDYKHIAKNARHPVISIEHRLLYDFSFRWNPESELTKHPPLKARIVKTGSDITIAATSYMVQEAQKAEQWVREKHGIECEIIDIHNISDIDHDLIFQSVKKTGRLIVADTSWLPFGVGSEIARGLLMRGTVLTKPLVCLGMAHAPTPTSHALEELFYPDFTKIIGKIYETLSEGNQAIREFPSAEFRKTHDVKFKGPF